MPEAGWYPLPSDPSKLMYWDGVQWVGEPIPAPAVPQPPARSTGAEVVDTLLDRAKEFATDEKNQGTAMAIAGGAAIADGVVGIGKRPGIGSAVFTIFFGIMFAVISASMLSVFDKVKEVTPQQEFEKAGMVQVVDLDYNQDGFCLPQVSVEGAQVKLPVPVHSKPCQFSVGDMVGVYYTPGEPSSVRLSSEGAEAVGASTGEFVGMFRLMFIGAGVFIAAGGVFKLLAKLGVIAGGSVLMAMGLRKRKAAQESREAE